MTALVLPGISIRMVQQLVATRCRVKLEDMTSPSRKREVSWPRQIAMSLAREFTRKSLCNIGRHFGGRDHSTVLNAVWAVDRRNQKLPEQRQIHGELWTLLNQLAPKPAEEDMPDLYAELGVAPDASSDDIKAAHRRAVRQHHPDRGGDKAKFQHVQLAYDTLKDRDRRQRYDRTGETAGAEQTDPAIAGLAMLFDSLLDRMLQDGTPIETADMRAHALAAVQEKLHAIKAEKGQMQRALAKAKSVAKRFKRKRRAKGPDMIAMTLERKQREIEEAIRNREQVIGIWEHAKQLLETYEYTFEASPAPEWRTTNFRFTEFGDLSSRP